MKLNIKEICWLFFLVTVFLLAVTSPVFAQQAQSSGDEIWTKLAKKAAKIGHGLQHSGFIIGGMGLIFFSFMAIFNKISWKNLAYIMLSCFVLSAMVALINYFSKTTEVEESISERTFNDPGDSKIKFEGGVTEAGGTPPS